MRTTLILAIGALVAAGAGCMTPDDELGETALAASGGTRSLAPGFVSYKVGGAGPDRSGVLVGPRLVLTSGRFVTPWVTAPSSVVVSHSNRVNSQTVTETRVGRFINWHPQVRLAVIELDRDFTNLPTPMPVLSTQLPAQLTGLDIVCRAFDDVVVTELTHITTRLDAQRNLFLFDESPDPFSPDALDDWNSGAACVRLDPSGDQVVAIVECVEDPSTPATECTSAGLGILTSAGGLADWLDDMRWLSQVRARASAYALQSSTGLCWDIAGAGVWNGNALQQYPCHGGANQWFYVDHAGDPTYARLVSAQSGKCIDVPSADTRPGRAMQQYKCWRRPSAQEKNQRFDVPDLVIGRMRGPIVTQYDSTLCLGVRGGPTLQKAPIETQRCSADAVPQQFGFATGLPVDDFEEVEPVRP